MKLYGKNSVIERLRVNPQSVKKIYIQQGLNDVAHIRKKAKQHSIPVFSVPPSKLLKMARSKNTQGVLGDVTDFDYVPYDELLDKALKKNKSLLFLDGLNDPQNLGAIMRSVACLGGFSIILPTHRSVKITESVLRVASGADNYIEIGQVSNLKNAIKTAKDKKFWIAGAVAEKAKVLYETALSFPLGVVIGSEQKGIRDIIRKELDMELTIPMSQSTLSLNAAHATAIFCYEIKKQKEKSFKRD